MGSIPVGESDFFFVPRSRHVEYSIFSNSKCTLTANNNNNNNNNNLLIYIALFNINMIKSALQSI